MWGTGVNSIAPAKVENGIDQLARHEFVPVEALLGLVPEMLTREPGNAGLRPANVVVGRAMIRRVGASIMSRISRASGRL
jgi:hypothetical protein